MALALYRKYRPATFSEVVGQEHVTDPLRTALAAGRINHAYLFSGPRGCGKTSSARIMARSLNCVNGPTPDPCGECNSCKALAPEGSGSVDVTELDAASHGGVDDARELRDRAFYAPAESRYRVFIIDEAHMVTTQGFNALLKIVEEPPEHLIFIFATTEPEKVLSTIRSRTHHYPFRLIPPSAMRDLLERNVAAEGVKVDPAVYPLVIRAGGGSARDTQSVLDQLLAGAGPDGVDYGRAVSLLGVTDVALIDDMVDGLAADDSAAVFGTVERLTEAGHDPRRFATDLLDRLRDLILLRAVPDAVKKGLIAAPSEELERMQTQSEKIGGATLSRYAEIVHSGLLEMRGATAPRLLLELLCARMLLPAASEGEAAVLQRLERMERRIAAGTVSAGPSAAASVAENSGTETVSAGITSVESRRPVQPAPERLYQRPSTRPETPSASVAQTAAEITPPTAEPVAAPIPDAPVEVSQEEMPADPPPIGAIDAVAIRRAWPQLLDGLRKTPGNRSTGAMLAQASVQSVEGTTVILAHPAAPLAKRLAESHNTEKIASIFREILGGEWQIKCVHADAVTPPQASVVKESAPRSFQRSVREQPDPAPVAQSNTQPVAAEPEVKTAENQQVVPTEPAPSEEPPESRQHDSVPALPKVLAVPPSDEVYEQPEEDFFPDAEEDSGVAEASENDPAVVATKLLEEHLGARRID